MSVFYTLEWYSSGCDSWLSEEVILFSCSRRSNVNISTCEDFAEWIDGSGVWCDVAHYNTPYCMRQFLVTHNSNPCFLITTEYVNWFHEWMWGSSSRFFVNIQTARWLVYNHVTSQPQPQVWDYKKHFDKIILSGHSCWFAYFKLEIVCSWTCNICCWGNAKWGSWDLNLLLLKLVWISTVLKCRSYISSDGLFQVCKCMSETWMCTCMSGIRNTHLIMAWCKIKTHTL